MDIEGSLEELNESLNDHEDLTLFIANNVLGQSMISSNQEVTVKYNGVTIFRGTITGGAYGPEYLKPIGYNLNYHKMQNKPITGTYEDVAASTIFADICAAAGVVAGTCPSTTRSVRFANAYCINAAKFLAMSLNTDIYTNPTDGKLYIGNRGVSGSVIIPIDKVSKHNVDRAYQKKHVIGEGIREDGETFTVDVYSDDWTPGTDNIHILRSRQAMNEETLIDLCYNELEKLEKESAGTVVRVTIDDGYDLYPGDTITINDAEVQLVWNLNGDYRIWKTTKTPGHVDLTIDRPENLLDKYLVDLTTLEEQGIFLIGDTSTLFGDLVGENLCPNGAFELDSNGDGVPDYWETVGCDVTFADISYRGERSVRMSGDNGYLHLKKVNWIPISESREFQGSAFIHSLQAMGWPKAPFQVKVYDRTKLLKRTIHCDKRTLVEGWNQCEVKFKSAANERYLDVVLNYLAGLVTLGPLTLDDFGSESAGDTVYFSYGQTKSIQAKGLYWTFYYDPADAKIKFRTSPDVVSASVATVVAQMGGGDASDFAVVTDGEFVYYARTDLCEYVYFRMGRLNIDGTITWLAAEQQAAYVAGHTLYYPSICVNTSGYVFIGYDDYDMTNDRVVVTKNSVNDGTWITDTGFPFTLNSTTNIQYVRLIALLADKIAAIYNDYTVAFRCRIWDTTWSSEEIPGNYSNVMNWSATSNASNDLLLGFQDQTDGKLYFMRRTWGTGWGSKVLVHDPQTDATPLLFYEKYGWIYYVWAYGDNIVHQQPNSIVLKKSTNGGVSWDTDYTILVTEDTNKLSYDYLDPVWAYNISHGPDYYFSIVYPTFATGKHYLRLLAVARM